MISESVRKPIAVASVFIVAGFILLLASFLLMMDQLAFLKDPAADLRCSFNILISCRTNLGAWQGEIFGFPNPILGLMTWPIVIMAGILLLSGIQFPRWFWVSFAAGITGSFVLVLFFIYASLFQLYVLCPWCMTIWLVVFPLFWTTILYTLKEGYLIHSDSARSLGEKLYSWVPVFTVVCYIIFLVVAQIQVDWIHRAFV